MTDGSTYSPVGRTKTGSDKGSFAHDMEQKASDFAEGASDTTAAALEKGKQLVEVAGTQAKEASVKLASRIKESPLSAVGIAFGVGVLFALLRK